MANKLGFFLAGGIVGAATALLCAPRTGAETRALVADKANGAVSQVQVCANQAQERGAQVCDSIAHDAQACVAQARDAAADACTAAQDRVSQIRENVTAQPYSESNEELRQKIEEARERIAAQVAANAEASKAAPEVIAEDAPVEE